MADWSDFAVASAGAAAALTGLLFVAVSINLQRILELPQLPDRAGGTLGLLLTLLLVSIVLVAPGQPQPAAGGGISTAIQFGGGLYWVLGGVLAGFVGASLNAWVLLVEIQR